MSSSVVTHVRRAHAAAALSISISGNHFVDQNGTSIRLLGVNRSGSEYMCTGTTGAVLDGPTDLPSLTVSVVTMASWNINVVRVPLNEDCWLGINSLPSAPVTATSYEADIVSYVNLLHTHGIYAILELHWNAPGTQQATGQQVMVDADHGPTFWTSVANTFKTDPGVLFDLYNEPQGISWTCWRDGCVSGFQTVGMQSLVNTVRGTGANQPILLGGIGYAGDVSQWSSFIPTGTQIAASFHTYDFVGNCNGLSCASTLLSIAATVPVVTGELGETDCTATYINTYMPWADANGISYLGWAWDPYGCGFPALIADWNGTPSTLGLSFKNHLATLVATKPSISAVAPNVGPATGGASVTITGANFTGATGVKFGTKAAAGFSISSATRIIATSPAGTGIVDVTVTTPGGTTGAVTVDHFTYSTGRLPSAQSGLTSPPGRSFPVEQAPLPPGPTHRLMPVRVAGGSVLTAASSSTASQAAVAVSGRMTPAGTLRVTLGWLVFLVPYQPC